MSSTTTAPATTLPRERVTSARTAVFVVFALAGLVFASWASRIADTKAALGLSAGELGLILLAMSAGSVTGLPLAGLLAVGTVDDLEGPRPVLAAGLFLIGLGVGLWDVAMNLEGATVEHALGTSVMPHFHAAFSGGTVLSALLGAAMSWGSVPLLVHFAGAVLVTALVGLWAVRSFLPRGVEEGEHEADAAPAVAGHQRSAWLEPRTLLIGVVVFAAAATEGTANDWLSVAFVEGHELPNWAGVLGFATFLTFMTVGRLLGTRMLDTYGRVPVLRVSFGLAVAGALLVIFGTDWMAFVGAAVWGVGAALGFPVGISASADDPQRAAARMSVVATIGYVAFIAGPPTLGFLGDHVGVLHSLLVVGALAVLALSVVPSVREPQRDPAA